MNEPEYTNRVIIPLLRHMGYMEVTYNHGINEFGKDIVFSEYDRFGNKKYHAAQVKVGNISGGNNSIMNDIINHTQNAFNIEFQDLITKTNVSISDFFLITSGKFVGNAKTRLLDDKRLQPYKHRIYFYEGHHIEELFEKSYKDIRELYMAQWNELRRNIEIANVIIGILSGGGSVIGKYIDYNLPTLIDKLCVFENQVTLRQKLESYQLLIAGNNSIITYMPIMGALMGNKSEKERLIKGANEIVSASAELVVLIVRALTEK